MNNHFPPDFIHEIDRLLENKSPAFWTALETKKAHSGLRVNTLKITPADLNHYLSCDLKPLSWTPDGFNIQPEHNLGKHPYHAAGLFYLQEPSAMASVSILDPQPGELILDLCAAPGGKTTHILSLMKNQGVLIANDSNPKRIQALIRNIDRWGARNSIVTCETPKRLAGHFGAIFDRVLVDAPCSGEGTFRSAPGEIKKWSMEFSKRCSSIQDEILWFAGKLVKPGGILVYSTCTFNQLENEGSLSRFIERNQDYSLDKISTKKGFSPGLWSSDKDRTDLQRSVRIWPHSAPGEGHFIARLKKVNKLESTSITLARPVFGKNENHIYRQFFNQTLKDTPKTSSIHPDNNSLSCVGNQLYYLQIEAPSLIGLRVMRWGWMIGTIKSDRFLPSPGLASGISRDGVQKVIEFPLGDPALSSYMRGSPVSYTGENYLEKAWVLVLAGDYPLGWGRFSQGKMRSHFPKWLR